MKQAVGRVVRQQLEAVQPYVPGTPIEAIRRQLGLSDVVKLASNENALGPSPKALAAIRAALAGVHRYPESACPDVRAALARRLKVGPDHLVFGNGSDEIIVLVLRACVEPGDAVIVAEPTFLIYEVAARVQGATVVTVPMRGLRYDLQAMARAVTPRTKVVFIANPDNPTGSYVTRDEVAALCQAVDPGVLLVFDEAYYEYVTAQDYPRTLELLSQRPVVITRTFSKAYGLAGLRIGYGIMQPELAAYVERVREPFNVNTLAQVGALAALDDTEHVAAARSLVQEGRRVLADGLRELGCDPQPSQANFVLASVGPRAPEVARGLLQRGIIVRDMRAWKLDGYIRITVGTAEENARCLDALRHVLDELASDRTT